MSILNEELKNLIENKNSIKVVSTQDKEGVINSAPKGSLQISADDELTYVEVLESSKSYSNVVYSIWFDKKVSVLVVGENKEAYLIHGHVKKILTCGREYEEYYRKYQEARGFDIAAAVKLTVEDVKDLNLAKGIEKQKTEHPFFSHYDSLAVNG
jgi:general stress protein 26